MSSITVPYAIVHAFTSPASPTTPKELIGNPAAVILNNDSLNLTTEQMELLGKELNQPMTSIVTPTEVEGKYKIRWFSGKGLEGWLCGHGTLAAGKYLFENSNLEKIEFESVKFGTIVCTRDGDSVEFQFPLEGYPPAVDDKTRDQIVAQLLLSVKGSKPSDFGFVGQGTLDTAVEYLGNAPLAELDVDAAPLASIETRGINITALSRTSSTHDIELRAFAPRTLNPAEDPVTGSAHSLLIPFWIPKLGLDTSKEINLISHQVSASGGRLGVRVVNGKNLFLKGYASVKREGLVQV